MFDSFLTEKQILRKLGGDKNSYLMTYDGKLDDKLTIPLGNGVYFVKVSDKVLTKEELLGATYVSFDGKTIVIADKNIFDNSAVGATTQFYGVMADNMTDAPTIVSCKACTIDFGGFPLTVPSDGTYFIYFVMGSPMYVSSLSKETIVPIDQKYLPGKTRIELSDYGIYPDQVVASGGGKVEYADVGTFWEDMKADNVVFVSSTGYEMTPVAKTSSEISFRMIILYGGIVDAQILIQKVGSGATMYVIVNMQSLPT